MAVAVAVVAVVVVDVGYVTCWKTRRSAVARPVALASREGVEEAS